MFGPHHAHHRVAQGAAPPPDGDQTGPEAEIERAVDVLTVAFGIDSGTAREVLAWAAEPTGADLAAIAGRFLDGAAAIVFDRPPPAY